MPFGWITGDEVYGDNGSLRVWLEQQNLHFVFAVRRNCHVWNESMRQVTVEKLAQTIALQEWQTLSAEAGAKGPRWHDWSQVKLLS